MTHRENDLLGAYALGVLGPDEAQAVHRHVASCTGCRQELAGLAAVRSALAGVPAEAILDGPREDSDPVLRRALGAVRADKARAARRRTALVAAGFVLVATAATGTGVLVGRHAGTPAPSAAQATATPVPPGARAASGADPKTGATIRTAVTPAAGWVRVHADVQGIKAGKRCQLVVVAHGGGPVVAGSWLASAQGETDGTTLSGFALVAAADVAAVEVVTFDNEKLVSATF